MAASDAALLSGVSLFRELDDPERSLLASGLEVERVAAGESLIKYGDPSGAMYIVRAGRAEVFVTNDRGERILLETVEPGAVIGEIALLTGGLRTASVVATEPLEVLRLDRDHLDGFLRSKPDAALDLLAVVGRRLQESNAQLRHTATRNANEIVEDHRTAVQKAADWIAAFSGSIAFLNLHLLLFGFWVIWNAVPTVLHFDPFPFGLLNVGVNLESVLLATFVLISQRREGEKDRVRSDVEYEANLNAERSVAHLHVKVDELRSELLTLLAERDGRVVTGEERTR